MATETALPHDAVAWLLLGTGLAGGGAVITFSHAGNCHDRFIGEPSLADRERLLELGVRWLFIETADGIGDLRDVATLRLDSAWASVWEIVP